MPKLRGEGGEAMTGIERLREWANELREAARAYRDREIDYVPIDVEACQRKNAAKLDAIADQIERETLPRPRFEDGELVRCGDMAMFGNKPREVVEYEVNDCGVAILHTYGDCWSLLPGQCLKRPEPPDTWERVEADVNKGGACRYFGVPDSEEDCSKCPALWDEGDMSCAESMVCDVLRRCKALAGVGVE